MNADLHHLPVNVLAEYSLPALDQAVVIQERY